MSGNNQNAPSKLLPRWLLKMEIFTQIEKYVIGTENNYLSRITIDNIAIRQTDEHRELYSGSAVVMRISHKILAVYLW